MKPNIHIVCFGDSTEEQRIVSKVLSNYSDQIVITTWDPSVEEPPRDKMTMAVVVFGYIAGHYLKQHKGKEDYFFLPLVSRARANEKLKETSIKTLNQLKALVSPMISQMPDSVIEIPEIEKALSRYKGEELVALLEINNTATFKLYTKNGDVISIGKGEEADLSLEELVSLRLATELFPVESIEIERKSNNVQEEASRSPRADAQAEGVGSPPQSEGESARAFHLDRIRRGAASKRTAGQKGPPTT